ncbi:MAG: polyphosphate:AMP phosphotransferase [Polyangiaceae bacterium]|nr:polyphosphate:AMP phosphotransferase [Polyangiaceae bacterium]
MFESAELPHAIDDATYKKQVTRLRADLLDAQYELLEKPGLALVVLVNGVDAAGKGEAINVLNEWLDPRHVKSHAFGVSTFEEVQRPRMWRYWMSLPPKGEIGILFGNWYEGPIWRRVHNVTGEAELGKDIERIRRFERMLVDENAPLLKLWFHLSKKQQKKRLASLEKNKLTAWRVTKLDWEKHAQYNRYRKVSERVLRDTSTGEAPWNVIDGSDPNYCSITVGNAVLGALCRHLEAARQVERAAKRTPKKEIAEAASAKAKAVMAPLVQTVDTARLLRDLPFKERLSKAKYATKIQLVQGELAHRVRSPKMKDHAVVVVFEGVDAAGKGGAIRRITSALDTRIYSVIPIAAPTDEEKAHPYLWRFWRHLPPRGRFVIYDRSWYGRVLVERVEGLAEEAAWMRAYTEINEFEEELVDHGIIVVKLWLAITKDEQLKRFKERETTAFKQYKITPEDWRNRKRWDDYVDAASEMIDRTSTESAPWTIIEANDKHLARVRAIETITSRLDKLL